MIVLRVTSNALQGVDPTESDIDLGATKLVNGSSEALCNLAGTVQAVREPGEHRADNCNQTGERREQCRTDSSNFSGGVIPGQPSRVCEMLRKPFDDEPAEDQRGCHPRQHSERPPPS